MVPSDQPDPNLILEGTHLDSSDVETGPQTNKLKATVDVDTSEDIDITSILVNGKSLGDPTAVNKDGLLADIDVSSITTAKKPKGDSGKDIKHLFGPVNINKPGWKVDSCRICLKCPGGKKSIVMLTPTLRRQLESDQYTSHGSVFQNCSPSLLHGTVEACQLWSHHLQELDTSDASLMDLTVKSEPVFCPLPFGTQSVMESGQQVIELLSDSNSDEPPDEFVLSREKSDNDSCDLSPQSDSSVSDPDSIGLYVGLIIFTCFTSLFSLLDDSGVKAFKDDTTFKRIKGDLNEWEVVIFYNALNHKIKIKATGKDIMFACFMPNGNLPVMNADIEAAQALRVACSFMKTNVPSFSNIITLDPRPLPEFAHFVASEDYKRPKDFMYIDSVESLKSFSDFIASLGVKRFKIGGTTRK
ncbi:hypothetical protein B0H13DRAFT_1885362 [Mycena leptocephala]|nr:hypothetical protein B0H13DRAFT_1885362 [Mycena leptocephala]